MALWAELLWFLESCYTYKYEGVAIQLKQDPLNMWWPPGQYDSDSSDTNATSSGNNPLDSNSTDGTNITTLSTHNSTGLDDNSTNNKSTQPADGPTKLKRRFFYVYFTSADETTYNSDRLVDFANFISSVGGNLGLFLGFSFLGLLFTFYEKAEVLYRNTTAKQKW